MAVSTPTLGGNSLPVPNAYSEQTYTKGATSRMASGALVRDLVQSGRKVRITLGWEMLTDAQRAAVHTGLGSVLDGSSATLLSPTGTSYTVVLADNGMPDWQAVTLRGTEWRWNGQIVLEEV